MAQLLDTKHVQEVAFSWGGTTRIFQADNMQIFGREDIEQWELSNGTRQFAYQGVWLEFNLDFRFIKRISPTSYNGHDMVDVINNLNDPTVDVSFYPMYDVDTSVSLIVIPNYNRLRVGTIDRQINKARYSLQLAAESRLSTYPEWLENTRIKPDNVL